MSVRLLVTGGRDYNDRLAAYEALDRIHRMLGIEYIVEGGAAGADTFAREWAQAAGVECKTFPAHWDVDGKAAGPIRNARMIREGGPCTVLAFPGGKGTRDMLRKAERAGLRIFHAPSAPWP